MDDKPIQMTLDELEAATIKDLPAGWRVAIKLLPDGHTQVRSYRAP